MMSNIPVLEQEPISIKNTPGQIPYQIRQAGISLPYPAAVINRGPTEYEARKNAYAKYQNAKLKASLGNPAIGALSFAADDVMGTADVFYESYVNYSEGNPGVGTIQLGFGLLALSGYTGGISRRGLKIINISDDIARAGSKSLDDLSKTNKVIGLGLDLDLASHRGTGTITYKNAGWQNEGLTTVDWGRASMDEYYFKESFKEAAENADIIRFDVSNFNPFHPKPKITNYEFNHILNTPNLLNKTVFVEKGKQVFWNGTQFIK